MYEYDYIMRMINDLARFLAKFFFDKDMVVYKLSDEESYTQTDYVHKQLLLLIKEGKINEAENLLFEKMDPKSKKYMKSALDFYERLNNLDDQFLEKNNFSREEIGEGLKAIAKEFGLTI